MEIALLKYNKYEKGKLVTSYYVKEKDKPTRKTLDLSFLDTGNIKTIISFDFFNIIDNITNIDKYSFIDVEQQLKQILGLSKNYFDTTKKKWSFWYQIRQYINKDEIKKYRKIYENLIQDISDQEIDRTLFLLVEYLYNIYESNKKLLKTESSRFEEVEKPLNTILFERTQKGIAINNSIVVEFLNKIIEELYEVRNKLQLEYSIFSSKDYNKIKQKILDLGFTDSIDKIGTEKYYNFLKFHQDRYELINLLYKERRLSDSKAVLTRLGSFEDERVYPFFEYFGTVTSRILVKNPPFQQLKKEYRNVIIPDTGKSLLYIDYCQFEAGILAHEMKDQKLIELYNLGDIYSKMQEILNNSEFDRDKCKSLFFLYSYGASFEQIKKKYTSNDIEIFFNQFSQFKPYKLELETTFKENGFISTLHGNCRYRTPNIDIEDDLTWLVSQKIQGTASLIVKKAINTVYSLDKEIEFLLPMHDAVLYQVPSSKIDEKKELIKNIFEKELKEICSSLLPKIKFKEFTE